MKKTRNAYTSMSRGEKIAGFIWLAVQFFLPWLLHKGIGLLNITVSEQMQIFLPYLIDFLAIVCIFHKFLKSSAICAWHDLWNFVQAVVLGFVALYVCNWLANWIMGRFLPAYTPVVDVSVKAFSGCNRYLRIVCVVILAPVIDEILYRGLIFRNVWRKSKAWAYILSIAVFAAAQTARFLLAGDFADWAVCFAQYLPAGLCLAWTYAKADNLYAPVVVHGIMNAILLGIL